MLPRKPGTPFNIVVWVGVGREVVHVLTEDGEPDGTPVNLVLASGKALIKTSRLDLDAAVVAEWVVDLTDDPGNGVVKMTLTPAESAKLAIAGAVKSRFEYDLHIVLADTFQFVGMWGYVEAEWPSTRAPA